MTQEERITQLEQENAELRAQLAEAYQQINQLAERLQRVEGQLTKTATTAASLRRVTAQGESPGASVTGASIRREVNRGMQAHLDASGQS